MSKYSYNIQTNNKNLSEFIFGDDWLIGTTSENSQELLKRLKIHIENDKLSENLIKNTIYDFVEWYKQDYEKIENEPCFLEEDEIVLGVGIAKFDKNGLASLFRLGSFNFYLASNPKTEIIDSSILLQLNEKLIADPKKANIVDKIRFEEGIDVTKYSFPFAIIQPEIVQEVKKTTPLFKYISMALAIPGLILFGWFIKDKIVSILPDGNNSTEFVSDSPSSDTTTIVNDSMMAVAADTTKYPIDYIVDKGKITLNDVKDLMNSGYNSSAIQKLDSLEKFVTTMSTFNYDHKNDLYDLLNEISLLKKNINAKNEF